MILDTLQNATFYYSINPLFQRAFEFLMNKDLSSMGPGKYAIEGADLYVIISDGKGKGKKNAQLEAHRKYIDIQFVISGEDTIGWKPAGLCLKREKAYEGGADAEFFSDEPYIWCPVTQGSFAVFFPGDAHAPLAGETRVKKAVLKVGLATARP